MSAVGLVSEEQASPEVKQIFQEVREQLGFVPNMYLAIARSPEMLKAMVAQTPTILVDGALTRKQKEEIGLVVSGINASSYCVAAHMEFLHQLGVEKQVGRKLATNYEAAPANEKTKVLYRFADKLTGRSGDIERADLERVREAGWSEDALFETVMTVAYFNFVNKVSIGLGLVADF